MTRASASEVEPEPDETPMSEKVVRNVRPITGGSCAPTCRRIRLLFIKKDQRMPLESSYWEKQGFSEVNEVVEERIYDGWLDGKRYRFEIFRRVVGNSEIPYDSIVYEAKDFGEAHSGQWVWVRIQLPSRLQGKTAMDALRDAVRWCSSECRMN